MHQALEMFYNQVEICKGFPRILIIRIGKVYVKAKYYKKKALNSIIKYDEPANMFMLEEKKMTGLLSIVKSWMKFRICSRRFIYTAFVSNSER
jgi:type I restriction enzyme R subunit